MTLQFFAEKPPEGDGKRYRAINTVGVWLWSRNHLPKDLVAALYYLVPELKRRRGESDAPFQDSRPMRLCINQDLCTERRIGDAPVVIVRTRAETVLVTRGRRAAARAASHQVLLHGLMDRPDGWLEAEATR
jgi:hypothetical protein